MGTQKTSSKSSSKAGKVSLFSKAKNALLGAAHGSLHASPRASLQASPKANKSKGKTSPQSGHVSFGAQTGAGTKKTAPVGHKKPAGKPSTRAPVHHVHVEEAKGGKKIAAGASGKAARPVDSKPVKGTKGMAMPVDKAATAAAKAAAAAARRAEAALAKAQAHDDSVCREVACEGLSTTAGYCRMHYIKNWKKIKRKELILKEGKLNQYIEELVAKYPDKYIEAIRQDLASDKDFAEVIHDLDLDESIDDFDVEGEGVEGIIDSIKRDFDDEGETF